MMKVTTANYTIMFKDINYDEGYDCQSSSSTKKAAQISGHIEG